MIKLEDLKVGDQLRMEDRSGLRVFVWAITGVGGEYPTYCWISDTPTESTSETIQGVLNRALYNYLLEIFSVSYIIPEEVFSL